MKLSTGVERSMLVLLFGLFLISACLACAVDNSEGPVPEFFGVYLKMTDGKVLELKVAQSFRASQLSGNNYNYVSAKPNLEVHASDIAGFWVYGDYDVSSFTLTEFKPLPANLPTGNVINGGVFIKEGDTGPGILNPGTFVDTNYGWQLERSFRHVEKRPKLYWIVPREGVDFSTDAPFVAVSLNKSTYFPFTLAKAEYKVLLDEANKLRQDWKLEEALAAAKASLGKKASADAIFCIAECEMQLGRRQEAREIVNKGLEQFREDPLGLPLLACGIADEAEDYEACVRLVKPLVNACPFGGPYNSLAWAYVRTGQNTDEAVSLAAKAVELAANQQEKAAFLHTLAEAYLVKGDTKAALDNCEKGLKCDARNGALLLQRAKLAFLQKEIQMKDQTPADDASRQRLGALVSGTWLASLTHDSPDPRFRKTEVRLVIKPPEDPNDLKAEYSFKLPEVSEWASFEMQGRFNTHSGEVMLLGVHKTHNCGPPWWMVDLFGEVSKDLSTVKWVQPGSHGEFRKEP